MTAAGRHATTVLAQSSHVSRFSPLSLLGENGFSRWKKITHTARMAPSWMTTRNMFQKSSETFIVRNWLSSSMCPVDEMGSHSVMPSTMPNTAAFTSSMISTAFPSPGPNRPIIARRGARPSRAHAPPPKNYAVWREKRQAPRRSGNI